ncbi:MAG: hypothetical protein NTY01_22160 [Verrucomicrobia bacterium]|nr:hypothetical protein [Verrucomicrobiota bacterium]
MTATSKPNPAVQRWLMPDFSACLWLALLLVLLAEPSRTSLVATDGDACMHWRVGEDMLRSGRIVHADTYSHTMPGAPVVTKEWLAEILFAAAGRLGGLLGLGVAGALVIATTFWLLHRRLLRDGNDLLVATLVTVLAAWAGVIHWLARPHVFTFLMVVLWNGALRQFETDGRAGRLAATLAALMLFWVNLHGAFLVGFIILGAYWLGAAAEFVWPTETTSRPAAQRKIAMLTLAGLLALAVSLLNPNGWHLHQHNLQFMRSSYLTSLLFEHRPIDFHSPDALGFVLWLAALVTALAVRQRPRLPASAVILVAGWTCLSLYAVRNIPLMALVTAPIVASSLSACVRGRWRELSQRLGAVNAASNGWPVVAVVALAAITLPPRPTEMPPDRWPVNAVKFIKAHPEQFTGNMLNQHVWGGYLMWVMPERKVFVDGRTDFYGEAFIRNFLDMTQLQPEWREKLNASKVRWTLLTTDHPLTQALALLPDWRRAYTDPLATVFRRTQ